jgi:hypothetical protein
MAMRQSAGDMRCGGRQRSGAGAVWSDERVGHCAMREGLQQRCPRGTLGDQGSCGAALAGGRGAEKERLRAPKAGREGACGCCLHGKSRRHLRDVGMREKQCGKRACKFAPDRWCRDDTRAVTTRSCGCEFEACKTKGWPPAYDAISSTVRCCQARSWAYCCSVSCVPTETPIHANAATSVRSSESRSLPDAKLKVYDPVRTSAEVDTSRPRRF